MSARRRIVFGAIAIGLTLVFCLVFLEVALRIYCAVKPNVDVEFFRYANLMKGIATESGVGFMHRPDTHLKLFGVDVDINSRGFRDIERPREKPANTRRLALIGDSITFGWGVPYGERFSERVAKSWTESESGRFELINTGHGNYNTVQEFAMLSENLADDPIDGVLQVWYINDAELRPAHRDAPWYSHFYVSLFLWSKTDLLQRRFGGRSTYVDYYRDLYTSDAPGYAPFEEAIRATGEWAKARDLPWVFVVLPEFHDFSPDNPFNEIYDRVGNLALDAGAYVVDITQTFRRHDPSRLWVAYNDVHPNSRGHAIIAAGIVDLVNPSIFQYPGPAGTEPPGTELQ